MADFLASALGSGLLQGVKSYQDQRRLSMEEEKQAADMARLARAEKLAQTGLDLQLVKEGYELDGGSGLLKETDSGRRSRESRLALEKAHADAYRAAGKKSGLLGGKNRDIEMLPKEEQKFVEDTAVTNSKRNSVANLIDSGLKNWDSLTDEERIQTGNELLKAINMQAGGADAVGAEEAARLGEKLNFRPGLNKRLEVQFGRNLPGFKQDLVNTSKRVRDSIALGEKDISDKYASVGLLREPSAPKVGQTQRNKKTGELRRWNGKSWEIAK